ncbi:IS110 family transposase [Rhodococcus aetherivorans]
MGQASFGEFLEEGQRGSELEKGSEVLALAFVADGQPAVAAQPRQCGIDWAEGHHDIAVIDDRGAVLVTERISDDVAGVGRLTELILDHWSEGLNGLPSSIETAQGLLVAALRSAGADVFAINPLSVNTEIAHLETEVTAHLASTRMLRS